MNQTASDRHLRPYRELGRRIIQRWPQLIQLALLTFLASGLTALRPWPMKLLADSALGDEEIPTWLETAMTRIGLADDARSLVLVAALGVLFVIVANAVPGLLLSWQWAATGEALTRDLSTDMLAKQLRAPLAHQSDDAVGESMVKINSDSYAIYTLTNLTLIAPGRELLTLASMAALAWTLSSSLTLVAFVAIPLLVVLAESLGRRIRVRSEAKRELDGRFATMIQQTLGAMAAVQAFNLTHPRQRFAALADEGVGLARRETITQNAFSAVNGLVLAISSGLVLVLGGRMVFNNIMTLGSLLVFLGYVTSIREAVMALLGLWRARQTVDPSVQRVGEVLALPAVTTTSDAAGFEGALDPTLGGGLPGAVTGGAHIEFNNITFGYTPDQPILQNLNLTIKPGELIGLTGPSGSGKSTLIGLLPRLYDPTSGTITINHHNINTLHPTTLRNNIAVVLQEPFLFPVSIADNITFGNPNATPQQLQQAAQDAGVTTFTNNLPNGLNTIIGERGTTLSGGERQRIAIARALIRNAPIVILDEPTSALDNKTETDVMNAIQNLAKGRTTILITHRPTTLTHTTRTINITQPNTPTHPTPHDNHTETIDQLLHNLTTPTTPDEPDADSSSRQ